MVKNKKGLKHWNNKAEIQFQEILDLAKNNDYNEELIRVCCEIIFNQGCVAGIDEFASKLKKLGV